MGRTMLHSPSVGLDEPDLGAALAPLRLRNAGEQIADRLVTAIALGEFVPGQRLPSERDLATLLGVSRASVRDALHLLAAAGYVDIHRGRNGGAYVQMSWGSQSADMVRRTLVPHWQHFEALLDLRRLVEPLIARTASERRTDGDLEQIRLALADYVDAPDREASRAADQALHAAIASATHNQYLVSLSGQIRAQVSLGFQAEPYSDAIRCTAIGQHTRLVERIAAGEPDAAAALASEHFSLTETALRKLVARVAREPAGTSGR
jgi:GntR family transcriptional regulator, transcriptional repressor for pyruvate dehydrogenase complex